MSIWKDQTPAKKDPAPPTPEPPPPIREVAREASFAASATPTTTTVPSHAVEPQGKESLIASDLTIEGKIEGTGHVRIAGKFKGEVNVQGDLTIETGAKLNGGLRARKVVIAGELEGNIEAASQVELLSSGVLVGDLKAGSLTVAAGSRMRGHADFGWGDGKNAKPGKTSDDDSAT
ncbi:MAG TPA: polymer-forming cytoskeletal protein [Pseudoxanthomonas sp.]|nr:polymer-forming cytoskeletal protein [Pseudoxanthomonas sp.]